MNLIQILKLIRTLILILEPVLLTNSYIDTHRKYYFIYFERQGFAPAF